MIPVYKRKKTTASTPCLGAFWTTHPQCTYDGYMLRRFRADNGLFLFNTNFQHHLRRTATWYPTARSSLGQIFRITVSRCWRGSVQNCKSHWCAYAKPDRELVSAWFLLTLNGYRLVSTTSHPQYFSSWRRGFDKSSYLLLQDIWNEMRIPLCWSKTLNVPIFRKSTHSYRSHHRMSLLIVVTKVLESVMLRCLTPVYESNIL